MGHKTILIFSGNTNNGTSDSTFYLNVNNDSANSNVNISDSILFKNNEVLCPYHHGKTHYYAPLCAGREAERSGVTRQ